VKTLVAKRDPGRGSGSWPAEVSSNVMGFLLGRNEALITPDLLADPRFGALRASEMRVRAVLAVPLRVDNRVTGMLAVTHVTPGREWSTQDVQLLGIVAGMTAFFRVVIRLGERGAFINGAIVPPPRLVDVRDEVGAGDAFDAGFVYALLLGCEPSVCGVAGHIIAARALAGTGDWETLPQLRDVQRHLTEAAVGKR